MKKVILEDIENMKYLLGYKRGVVISEQTTPPAATPPAATPDTTTPTPTPTPAATTDATIPDATTSQPIKIGVKNPRVQVLQQLLNDKFQSGLVADGLYGPKTANAIYKNIIAINKQQIKPIEGGIQPVKPLTKAVSAEIPGNEVLMRQPVAK